MLAAITPTWAGSLPTWLLLVFGLAVAWRVSRGGGGTAVQELSKANEVLTKRTHELGGEVRDLRVENERLRSRTDFAQALAPIMAAGVDAADQARQSQESILKLLTTHEERAEARFAKTTGVLGLIADRLGPENDPPTGLERREGERRAS